MVQQVDVDFRWKAQIALTACCAAKNSTITRNGVSPEQAVYGRPLRWADEMIKDDDDPGIAVLGRKDGEAWLSTQARVAARMAIIEADASDKLKRAAVRRALAATEDLRTGTRVYFYSPHPFRGRRRLDAS